MRGEYIGSGIRALLILSSWWDYEAKIIMDYFGDGSKVSPVTGQPLGVNIEYFVEETPFGNAGALFQLKDKLTEDFVSMML